MFERLTGITSGPMNKNVEPLYCSVVIPVYGNAAVLDALVSRIDQTFLNHGLRRPQIILIDDCGPGNAWSVISQIAERRPDCQASQLMRNFGQHNALMCGFRYASGNFIVTIDDDLQHEPESIPKLLSCLNDANADLVYGVYEHKKHGGGRNLGSWLVNRFYRLIFGLPVTVTSFRAIRRELLDAVLRYDLNFTYIDGLLAWNTQRIEMVTVPHHARVDGKSGYTFSKLLGLAMNVFTNFSLLPLQVVSILGLLAAAGGIGLGFWFLIAAIFSLIEVPGYASTIVAVLILGGLQLLSLGIMGEYLGRLHMNVNRKPQYTIRQTTKAYPRLNTAHPDNKA
jgi:glycosyltransferase involved in cell wall biosynthesis